MIKRSILTSKAPSPAGAYSQGIVGTNLVFVSGQSGVHPTSGLMPEGIQAQTEQALANISEILHAAGSSLQHVVKFGVFLADLDEFQEMNAVFQRVLAEPRPARSTVQAGLTPEMRIEIDAIALTD